MGEITYFSPSISYWNGQKETNCEEFFKDSHIVNNYVFCNVLFEVKRNDFGFVTEYVVANYKLSSQEDLDFACVLGKEYLYQCNVFRCETDALNWLSQFECSCPNTPASAVKYA